MTDSFVGVVLWRLIGVVFLLTDRPSARREEWWGEEGRGREEWWGEEGEGRNVNRTSTIHFMSFSVILRIANQMCELYE